MSEAYGTVVIKAPKTIITKICEDDELVSWNAISQLLDFASVNIDEESQASIFVNEHNEFYHEGIERLEGMAVISIFGEQWMYLMESLTKQGRNIEAYGFIEHEHGIVGYFALNPDGKTFCKFVDYEAGDEEGSSREEWEKLLPADVATYFQEFDDESLDSGDSEPENNGWRSVDKCLTETVRTEDGSELLIVSSDLYYHPEYERSKLEEAVRAGASLVNPTYSGINSKEDVGQSLLNLVITDPEIEDYAYRKRLIEDILSLDLIDLNEVYCGYEDVGTPLYLAANEGYYEIVEMLLDRVADKNPAHPWRNDGLSAIDAAKLSRDAAMFYDDLGSNEGRDYEKVIELLEQAN